MTTSSKMTENDNVFSREDNAIKFYVVQRFTVLRK